MCLYVIKSLQSHFHKESEPSAKSLDLPTEATIAPPKFNSNNIAATIGRGYIQNVALRLFRKMLYVPAIFAINCGQMRSYLILDVKFWLHH